MATTVARPQIGTPRIVELEAPICEVAVTDRGEIVALAKDMSYRLLIRLDGRGRLLARTALPAIWEVLERISYGPKPLRLDGDGTAYVRVCTGILAVAADGACKQVVTVELEPDAMFGNFVLLPDGFLVTVYPPPPNGGPCQVLRLERDGSVRWRTDLRLVPRLLSADVQAVSVAPLIVSGELVLATFSDVRTGYAVAFCLGLHDGGLRWQTAEDPISTQAILRREQFVVGVQGYGEHRMAAYRPDGSILTEWNQHAYVVVDEEGSMLGPEVENIRPSRSHFSAFSPDGEVRRGLPLQGYYTGYPALTRTGYTIFRREMEGVVAVGPDGQKHILLLGQHQRFPWSKGPSTDRPGKGISTRILVTPAGELIFGLDHRLYIVPANLGPIADGPWPCEGGNLRNNPVVMTG